VRPLLSLVAIIAIAFGARLVNLEKRALWWDEGWSVYFASLPIDQMARETARDIHPPLYYALLHLWAAAAGYSVWGLRFCSVLAGVALVAAATSLAKAVCQGRPVLLTAMLAAVNPFFVYYSQELRMYSLVAAFVTLSWAYLVRFVRSGKAREAAACAAFSCLALYTEYYAALSLLGQVLWATWHWHRRKQHHDRPSTRLLWWFAIPVLAYLPWAAFAGRELLSYVAAKTSLESYGPLGPLQFLGTHLLSFVAGHSASQGQLDWVWLGAGLAGLAVGLFGGLMAREVAGLKPLIFCSVLAPLLTAYAVNLLFPFHPPYFERAMLPAAPPLLLLVACGAQRARRISWAHFALVAALSLAPATRLPKLWFDSRSLSTDYRPLFRHISQLGRPDDVVLCLHPWQYGYAKAYLPPRAGRPFLPDASVRADPAASGELASELLRTARVLWFPAHQTLGRVVEEQVHAALGQRAYEVAASWYGTDTLLLAYSLGTGSALDTEATVAWQPVSVHVLLPSGVIPAAVVPAQLSWQCSSCSGLHLSLRLLDPSLEPWASIELPADRPNPVAKALLLPPGIPPGAYTLGLVLSQGEQLLPLAGTADQFVATLSTVEVPAQATPRDALQALDVRPLHAAFANGLSIEGTQPLPQRLSQGYPLNVELWWRVDKPLAAEPILFLQAVAGSNVVAALEERLVGGNSAVTSWPAGALIRDRHSLLLPASAPAGHLRIICGLLDPDSRERFSTSAGTDHIFLGTVQVEPVAREFSRPALPLEPAEVPFGQVAVLEGFLIQELQATDSTHLQVTLVWKASSEPRESLKSFVHLSCGQTILAQSDHAPGAAPTTTWLPGQYIVDEHRLRLPGPEQACPARIELYVGLYSERTRERIPPQAGPSDQGRLRLAALP
jgi:hypothetical protein